MPLPLLDLEEAVETTCFRAVCAVLQKDPILSSAIKTWETLDGTSRTLEPPVTSQMPYLRAMGGPCTMKQAEAAAWEIDFTVYLTTATQGLHQDDQTNLWGAVRNAFNHDKPFAGVDVERYLRAAGATCFVLSSPGFGPYPPPSPTNPSPVQDLFGTARLVLTLMIRF